MKFNLLPKSKPAISAVIIFIIQILCLTFFFVMVNFFGQRGGETFFSNLWLTIPMLMFWFFGVISCILSVYALIVDSRKSLINIIIALFTLFTTILGIMQIFG